MNSNEILGMLLKKYDNYNWLSIPELRFGTGHSYANAIDLFVISKYAKHGYGCSIAFEIKISRQDFMNEIKNPSKRGLFEKNSNQFYFVCPKNLIDIDEIPEGCGLMEASKKITIKKIALQRKIEGYTPCFVASILSAAKSGYNIQDTKLFEYMGKKITVEDLDKLVKKRISVDEYDIKRNAFDKYKKEFEEKNNNRYKELVGQIAKLLDMKFLDSWDSNGEVYSNSRIISNIEMLIERADKINFTRNELTTLKRNADEVLKQIDDKLKEKKEKK